MLSNCRALLQMVLVCGFSLCVVLTSAVEASTISVSGKIVDTDYDAVGGAMVQCAENASLSTTSGSDGTYSLSGLPSDADFSIKVTKAGYSVTYTKTFHQTTNVANAVLTLFPSDYKMLVGNGVGGLIVGKAKDFAAQADPTTGFISGAIITATGPSGALSVTYSDGSVPAATTTVADGVFMIKNLTDGVTVTGVASKSGISFVNTNTYKAHADGITVGSFWGQSTTTNTLWFSGRLAQFADMPGMMGISGATVDVLENPSKTIQTLTDGSFTLTGLPFNAWITLRITSPTAMMYRTTYIPLFTGNRNINSPRLLRLLSDSDMTMILGVTSGKGVIVGSVRDAADPATSSVQWAQVTATGSVGAYSVAYTNPSPGLTTPTATTSDGRFSVINIIPGDTVTLSASAPGWTIRPDLPSYPCYPDGVTLGGLWGYRYSITGSVKDLVSNQGIPNVSVTVKDGLNAIAWFGLTDGSGNFTAYIVSPGTYSVTIFKTGYDWLSAPPVVTLNDRNKTSQLSSYLLQGSQTTINGLTLYPGWNFISFPKLPAGNTIDQVLGTAAASDVLIVWAWDSAAQQWTCWTPSVTGGLTSFDFGKGYWVLMAGPGTYAIDFTGWSSPGTTPVHLNDGWNLIGYSGTGETAVSTALTPLGSRWSIIWNWDNSLWTAKHETLATLPVSPLTTIYQGRAYWIRIKPMQACDWVQTP